jgi:CheY-like chemotaxis protein
MKEMRILFVEDDSKERERIEKSLREKLKDWTLSFVEKETESQFRRDFAPEAIAAANEKFDIAVLDLMMVWERTAREEIPQPGDVAEGGVENAGFRCLAMLRSNPATKNLPCVIYTHLNPPVRPEGVVLIPKGSDISPLSGAILSAVSAKS